MAKELSVRLHGLQVGVLRLVNGKMEFTYDENAQKPISLSLPLQKEPFKEKVCRAFLVDYCLRIRICANYWLKSTILMSMMILNY